MMIGRYIRQFFMKPYELYKAKDIDTTPVNTVGLIVGPYRNLTTLTGSVLMLHPNCQVLNHAGMRILNWKCLNFMRNPTRETWERFIRYAIYISGRGQRGDYGGSVTFSHAFQHEDILGKYEDRYGDKLIKNKINSVIWKESLRISKYIKNHNIKIETLIDEFSGLRFIQPIRNPLDCARSNIKTNMTDRFEELGKKASMQETLSEILLEYKWFLDKKQKEQDRFFYFMEYDFNQQMLENLVKFLELEPEKQWIDDVLEIYEQKSTYQHSKQEINYFKREVKNIFEEYPGFVEEMLNFVN